MDTLNRESQGTSTISAKRWPAAIRRLLDVLAIASLLTIVVWWGSLLFVPTIVNEYIVLAIGLSVAWLISSAIAHFALKRQQQILELEEDLKTLGSENIAAAKDLWLAAGFHRRQAAVNIGLLIVVLIGTSVFMIAAGYIANFDYGTIETFDLANRQLEAADGRITKACEHATTAQDSERLKDYYIRTLSSDLEYELQRAMRTVTEGLQPDAKVSIDREALNVQLTKIFDEAYRRDAAARLIDGYTSLARMNSNACSAQIEAKEKLREFYGPAFKLKYEAEAQRMSDGYRILRSMVLRISFGAFALFLATILLQNYRYNMNISNSYRTRFGTIVMGNIDVENAVRRAALLTVDNLKIGKDAADPLERLVELLKGLTAGRAPAGPA
jgi:hypothetical protein